MPIIALKLLMTPLMIIAVHAAGKRWGAIISGLLIGLPLTSGPISLILACQYGEAFAVHASAGNLAGQISICLFCLVYYKLCQTRGWLHCTLLATLTFIAATAILKVLALGLLSAFGLLLLTLALVSSKTPGKPTSAIKMAKPWWDLPSRIVIAVTFVLLISSLAGGMGPVLSGLIAPFPVFAIVFAAFTLQTEGSAATCNLLRGIVLSSVGFAAFFMTIGLTTSQLGLSSAYLLAAGLGILSNFIFHSLLG